MPRAGRSLDLPHDVTDAFQDRVRHAAPVAAALASARAEGSNADRARALKAVQQGLGDVGQVPHELLLDLLLSYRAVEAWGDMLALAGRLPDDLQAWSIVRQQTALALNRRNAPGDRDRAVSILDDLIAAEGADPESCGLLGRVHKDRYRDAKLVDSVVASAALEDAIVAYSSGFESDSRDYYPGVNAIMLLVEKGDVEAMAEVERLLPLVNAAVARRGGSASSDYWDLAAFLELACIGRDWSSAQAVLPRLVVAADESWKPGTTRANLVLLLSALKELGEATDALCVIVGELDDIAAQIEGESG